LLFEHFVSEFARLYEVEPTMQTANDLAELMAHSWPGNVRELRSVAERSVLAARRGGGAAAEALHGIDVPIEAPENLRGAVAAFERTLIARAIKSNSGRMDNVAEALGIGRRTLNEKIVKLGLNKDEIL
jgi:DNA-binding NtrC family response regulator